MPKPTPTEEKQVSDWFLKEFWPNYPAKFCGRGKGSRGISLKLMVSVNPDLDEQKRIIGNLKAQVRAHEQTPEAQRRFWKIGETYVRNQLWNDEIESIQEIKERQALAECAEQGCNEEVRGPKYKWCDKHIPCQHDQRLRQAWRATGLDRNSKTLREDCREYINKMGYGGII
jgi:hypothetical protein